MYGAKRYPERLLFLSDSKKIHNSFIFSIYLFGINKKSRIFAAPFRGEAFYLYLMKEMKGRLAQLVQSICLTSRGSAVRIRQRPRKYLIKKTKTLIMTSPK